MPCLAAAGATGNSTAPAVTIPATAVPGSVLLWMASFDGGGGETVAVPAGFTALYATQEITVNTEQVRMAWKRVVDASDAGASAAGALSGSARTWVCTIAVFGPLCGDPILGTLTQDNTGGASPYTATAAGVTVAAISDLLLMAALDMTVGGTITWSGFSGYAPRADLVSGKSNHIILTRDYVAAGATGDATGTATFTGGGTTGSLVHLVQMPVLAPPPRTTGGVPRRKDYWFRLRRRK